MRFCIPHFMCYAHSTYLSSSCCRWGPSVCPDVATCLCKIIFFGGFFSFLFLEGGSKENWVQGFIWAISCCGLTLDMKNRLARTLSSLTSCCCQGSWCSFASASQGPDFQVSLCAAEQWIMSGQTCCWCGGHICSGRYFRCFYWVLYRSDQKRLFKPAFLLE